MKLRNELNEAVWFIPFNEDPDIFLVNCLGIPQDNLHSVKVDLKRKQAKIVVEDRESAAMAVGSKGINIKLVSRITGLNIDIRTVGQDENSKKAEPAKSPEELLAQSVILEIPEIANGKITIVDMVREPGVQSKVVVKQTSGRGLATPTCIGQRKKHVNALIDKLKEDVWFVEFHEDPESYLLACLGVFQNRLLSININATLQTANILVNNQVTCARAIGENGINVKQATQLTGLRYIHIRTQEE